MQELMNDEHYGYKQYIRMEAGPFQEILARIEHCINKRNTTFRMALPAAMKLAFTLLYLATGESYSSLRFSFRVLRTSISIVIRKVCRAIIEEYHDEMLKCPETAEDWRQVAKSFERK
jgi:hypothetical protein